MPLKTCTLLILMLVGAMASQVSAQDMSGWSDKTLCRLLLSKSDTPANIKEAASRGLSCGSDEKNATKKVSSKAKKEPKSGLEKITMPQNWQVVSNVQLFDIEINSLRREWQSWSFIFGKGGPYDNCRDVMINWEKSIEFYIQEQNNIQPKAFSEDWTPPPDIDKCIEVAAKETVGKGRPTQGLQDTLLHWAQTDNVSLPEAASEQGAAYNYQATSSWAVYALIYALHYERFMYSHEERQQVDSYLAKSLKKLSFIKNLSYPGQKVCDSQDIKNHAKNLAKYRISSDTCGSLVWKALTAQLLLGLRVNDESLFALGLKLLDYQLHFFDDTGIFITWALKGPNAYHYSKDLPHFLGLITEILATAEYNFLVHTLPNGLTVKQVMDRQFDIFNDPMILYPYVKMTKSYRGVKSSEYANQSLSQHHKEAGINIYEMVRASARYVDTYRPDLAKYREVTYVTRRGHSPVSGFVPIDSYVLYVGNQSQD